MRLSEELVGRGRPGLDENGSGSPNAGKRDGRRGGGLVGEFDCIVALPSVGESAIAASACQDARVCSLPRPMLASCSSELVLIFVQQTRHVDADEIVSSLSLLPYLGEAVV